MQFLHNNRFVHHGKLRLVVPYFDRLHMHSKERWFDKPLVKAYAEEFWLPEDTVRRMVQLNHLRLFRDHKSRHYDEYASHQWHVNPMDAIIRRHDVLRVATLFTEIPVLADAEINIVPDAQRPKERAVIEKPVSLTMHPNAHFRRNTLQYYAENGIFLREGSADPVSVMRCQQDDGTTLNKRTSIWINNRLDRVVSGLTLVSLTKEDRGALSMEFSMKRVFKMYLAKVHGRLGQHLESAKDNRFSSVHVGEHGAIHIWNSLRELQNSRGLWEAVESEKVQDPGHSARPSVLLNSRNEEGLEVRDCYSMFLLLHYDPISDTSIIACSPVSGKSRQLREHLKYLGHPIVGDETTSRQVFETRSKSSVSPRERLWNIIDQNIYPGLDLSTGEDQERLPSDLKHAQNILLEQQIAETEGEDHVRQFSIHLHSLMYKSEDFYYRTSLPAWCCEQDQITWDMAEDAAEMLKSQVPQLTPLLKRSVRNKYKLQMGANSS